VSRRHKEELGELASASATRADGDHALRAEVDIEDLNRDPQHGGRDHQVGAKFKSLPLATYRQQKRGGVG